jgi:pimeloyl-ACP methyl ester carboxylesterase
MTARVRLTAFVVALAAAAAACRGPRLEREPASCTRVQTMREVFGAELCEDVWSCARPPGGSWDRVGLRRLAPCAAEPGPVLLYLPGMHMNAELPVREPRHDLRLYLAAAGVRTWGLDYRTHAVPPDAPADALPALGRWTAEVFVDDAAWAARFVRGADAGPLFLAGFSQGAGFAYRLAARPGETFAGLVILDGAAREGGSARGGGAAIDVGGGRLAYPARQALLGQVIADPAAPSPVPGFPSAGAALADILYSAPSFGGDGGLANTRDRVSELRVLATLLASYDRWWPRAALDAADAPASAARLPVLAFASTRLGPAWVTRVRESAARFAAGEPAVRELTDYGHLDVLVGRRAAQDVFEPTLAWLERGGR